MLEADLLWRVKLAARLHDPAEKSLVLFRDPAGHEGGTVRSLRELLDLGKEPEGAANELTKHRLFRNGWSRGLETIVKRADWWAAAADRPQWPTRVELRWSRSPALIHPLSGEVLDLVTLQETGIGDIKDRSFSHFERLYKAACPDFQAIDYKKLLLAFWRFGPELVEDEDFGKLGALWRLLPADTRTPDHSIWDHLDLVSAFAGAFAADPEGQAALLAFTIGPVQSFIAAARKTEDLWAGSHLLACLAWEAMKKVCERLGPDAIIFPRLRGVALTDVWLLRDQGLPEALFENLDWRTQPPDANPLFGAGLPNRFVAIVPASKAQSLAEECGRHVREWMLGLGLRTVDRLLETAGYRQPESPRDESVPAYAQMRAQLQDFPEVHWASVPFSLVVPRDEDRQTKLETDGLCRAMAPFFGVSDQQAAGFLATQAWKVLSKEIEWPEESGLRFYDPNPGVLYPAFFDLGERLLTAAKSLRAFAQSEQEGWRCTLTGEAEWLTHNRDLLRVPPGQRRADGGESTERQARCETLWTRIAERRPAWAREGEHLSALPAIKRLWPTLFVEELRDLAPRGLERFTVSTHTMALAHQLRQWLETSGAVDHELLDEFKQAKAEPVALPRALIRETGADELRRFVKLIPGYLDRLRDLEGEVEEDRGRYARARRRIAEFLGGGRQERPAPLETYYALILMDGDRLGALLSGDERAPGVSYLESFHPQIRAEFARTAEGYPALADYGRQRRPPSPARHMSISGALNDFSQVLVPHIVEEEHLGRLIYSGGDDVMAMLPVADVLQAIGMLRQAYRGEGPDNQAQELLGLRRSQKLLFRRGYAYLNGRLMQTMGTSATLSCGVVIAHHMAPLGFVLNQLRDAERQAKRYRRKRDSRDVDRDAFHIRIIKRSGSTIDLSADWGAPVELLGKMRDFLADPEVSRRAVYHTLDWLKDLPEPDDGSRTRAEALRKMLAYQLARQAGGQAAKQAPELADELVRLTLLQPERRLEWLAQFLTVAEFLARETRTGGKQ
jgi:CRISPR-associated protein Cmr2